MRFKSTLILLLVFAGLGSYVYFSEYRGQESRQKTEEAKKKAFQIDDKNLTEISVTYQDRTITGVRKGEHQWEITNPQGVEPDSEEWDRLASNLAATQKEQTVTSDKPELAQYGLDKPVVTINARLKDGKAIGVQYGGENPKKTFTYARLTDSPEVFLTSTTYAKLFQKSLTDLRNKKILGDFEADDIDSFGIAQAKGNELDLQKSGMDWAIKKPVETNGDSSEATMFLSSVKFAKAADFADPSIDAKAAGLEPPAMRITLHDAKAKADRTLLIGATKETDKYYAKDAARSPIFIIDKEIPEKAKRPIFDWRDKTIAKIDHDKVDEVEIVRGAEKISMKKSGSDWKLADGRKLQWEKVSALFNALDFEKAKQINDAPKPLNTYGLDKPKLEVTLRQSGKDQFGLKFGSPSKDPDGKYIKTSATPAVMVVSNDLYDKLDVKLDDMVETPPPPAPPTTPATPEKK